MLKYISFGEVDLSNNLLSGNIPSKIGYVEKLDRSHNLLSGSVLILSIKDGPYILGTKSFLSSLDLSYNNLKGNLPIDIASIPHINLSFNFFECPQGYKDFYAKSMIGDTPMSVNSPVQDQNTKKSRHLGIIALPTSCFFVLVIFVDIFCFIWRTKKVKV
ncbi:hypothetical protein S245_021019 [Arachis hypogaea]